MGEPLKTFILNRYKEDYLGHELPAKEEKRLFYPVSPEQWEAQSELIRMARDKAKLGAHLTAIQHLKLLYEHPALLREKESLCSAEELLRQSPKLQQVCEALDSIRRHREKALIFTRSLRMQDILKRVFAHCYGLQVAVINGSAKSGNSAGESIRYRYIREFEEQAGFNLLILSPDVAGVGLTIIGANHVIHYGRWWNPAMEDQATCRAYRIGQTLPVTVYIPIAEGPNGLRTFEQKLDELLRQKSQLRRDILTPIKDLEVKHDEIWNDL